jgi:hypothetical protein
MVVSDPLTTIQRRVAVSVESKGVEHVHFYDTHRGVIDLAIRDAFTLGQASVRTAVRDALGLRR